MSNATKAPVTIVIAWTEEDFRVVRERRTDMGERHELETFRVGKAVTWLLRGTSEDIAKAEVYARSDSDKAMRVYTFPTSCKDPLGAAKRAALAEVVGTIGERGTA